MNITQMLPPSTKRVKLHTNKIVNETIEQKTSDNLTKYKDASFEQLSERIDQLNREWDTERVLEANAATIVLISAVLAFNVNAYWLLLIVFVSFFLLQHAIQGWCPPLPIIRRLGTRSPEEIHNEKTIIKFLRGDFSEISKDPIKMLWKMNKD